MRVPSTGVPTAPAPLSPGEESYDKPSIKAALAAASQVSLVAVAPLILLPLLAVEFAEQPSDVASRAIVVSIIACALVTLLSITRTGPLRSNSLYIAVIDPMSIPFCILALDGGGLSTLAALVVVAGLFQIFVGMRLSSLRRIITPSFTMTIVVLACISVVPVFFRAIDEVSGARFPLAVPVCVLVTAATSYLVSRLAPVSLQLWAAPMGLVTGTITAIVYDIYRLGIVREAAWIGLPAEGWNILGAGMEESLFNGTFFSLLLSFLILSLVLLVRTNTSSLIAQFAIQPQTRSLDLREVQRANTRVGLGSVLSGLGGSMPLSYSPVGTSAVLQTGCNSRQLGGLVGGFFLFVAFCPKFQALMIAIPRALIGVYFIFILLPLLTKVASIPIRASKDVRSHATMSIPVVAGLLVEFELVPFPDGALWDAVSRNGLTTGSIVLLILVLIQSLTTKRRSVDIELTMESTSEVRDFVTRLSAEHSWSSDTQRSLEAVAEEALLVLSQHNESTDLGEGRRIRVVATIAGSGVELEFVSASTDAPNLEERIALLKEPEAGMLDTAIERDASLRLLRHYAESVSHRQYQDVEIITATVAIESGD